MVEKQSLLIRADADVRIGSGHVMRCLALAQGWIESGGVVYFASAILPDGLANRLVTEGLHLCRLDVGAGSPADAQAAAELAREIKADWLVVDGYHFGYEYQLSIKEHGLRLLVIDDYGHAGRYVADLILNQNVYATVDLYPYRAGETKLLLGVEYALLRREFWDWQGWERPISTTPNKLLVTLGGGDANNVTLRVIQAIQRLEDISLEVVIIVGGSNPHLAALQNAVRNDSRLQLVHNVDNMPELMAWADGAVSAAGSTCWELAFMGLPALLIILADNQRPIAEELDKTGICVNLGWFDKLTNQQIRTGLYNLMADEKQRLRMSVSGKKLVDGLGTQRVIRLLNRYD